MDAGYETALRITSYNVCYTKLLRALTARVAKGIDQLCTATGAERVHIIGHSMGGILARNYLKQRGGAKVASCITLGSPHSGSQLAVFAVSSLGRALLPGSPLLTQLNATPWDKSVPISAIYSSDDRNNFV